MPAADVIAFGISVLIGVVLVFFCIILVQLMFILRDLSTVAHLARRTTRNICDVVLKPAQLISFVLDRVSSVASGDIARLLGFGKKKGK